MRATQYLPDIVRLQQCLYDAFHHRLDKKEAVMQTVREFLDNLTTGEFKSQHSITLFRFNALLFLHTENARNEYQERIGSLQKAWALVGHMLKNHGKHCITMF